MSKNKKRARVGPSNPKYAGAVKKETRSKAGDDMKAGGTSMLGRTLNVKAHPSHPSVAFAGPRGRASGAKVADKALVGAKKPAMKKADAKKKRGD